MRATLAWSAPCTLAPSASSSRSVRFPHAVCAPPPALPLPSGAGYGRACQYRAKHDMVNSVSAGCFTGAVLAVRAGPQAAALGCVGFAAFSAAIDYFLEGNH